MGSPVQLAAEPKSGGRASRLLQGRALLPRPRGLKRDLPQTRREQPEDDPRATGAGRELRDSIGARAPDAHRVETQP